VEGEAAGNWILLDYDDVIVHVFLESVRNFYDLERLWSEAPRMDVADETVSLEALSEGM
jgi:ribosome-associated protein